MIDKATLEQLIVEGQLISNKKYFNHIRLNTQKTFFFFLKRLSMEQIQTPLSSPVLREFIKDELRNHGIVIDKVINPEGWFGRFWTDYSQNSNFNFKKEYQLILERTRTKPYYYAIKPEYYPLIKQVFEQFTQNTLLFNKQETNEIAHNNSSKNIGDIHQKNDHQIIQSTNIISEILEMIQTEERKDSEIEIFNPQNLHDERERCVSQIVKRRGQSKFRQRLIKIYCGKCAITDWNAEPALEAAHIIPYLGHKTNHSSNGILLRADIHTLFDLHLIAIDVDSMTILIAPTLKTTSYRELHGKKLLLPNSKDETPSIEALKQHLEESGLKSGRF